MEIKDLKFKVAKYKLNDLSIIIPGMKDPWIIHNDSLLSMIIEKDFDNEYFPFFTISVKIPHYVYNNMRKADNKLEAYMDLQKGDFDGGSMEVPEKVNSVVFISYIKNKFHVILRDTSPDQFEKFQELIDKENESQDRGTAFSDVTVVDLLLYRKDYLDASKVVVNQILSSANLLTALTYVLNKSNTTGVLISPPNNFTAIKEFILTPITAMEQLNRICNEYGLYTNGAVIFYDIKYMYILDKSPKCSAWVSNEYKTTYLVSMAKTNMALGSGYGSTTDSPTKSNYINISEISTRTEKETQEHVFGNNVTIIDASTGNVTNTGAGGTASKVVITEKGGSRSGAIKQEIMENVRIANVAFNYCDLDMVEPNKEFVLSLDDPSQASFNGKYRLSKMVSSFTRDNIYWNAQTSVELRG
jgi:hypothetical protein